MPIFESPFGKELDSGKLSMAHLRDLHVAILNFYNTQFVFGRFPDVDAWLLGGLIEMQNSMMTVARQHRQADLLLLRASTPLTPLAATIYSRMAGKAASREGVAYWREYFAKIGFGNPR